MNRSIFGCPLIYLIASLLGGGLFIYAILGWYEGALFVPGQRFSRFSGGSYALGERVSFIALSYCFIGAHIILIAVKTCARNKAPWLINAALWSTLLFFFLFLLGSLAYENG